MTLEEENAALKAENARLREGYEQAREHLAVLAARVQELEARRAKDRHTSSKPPSSDGRARTTKRLRRRSGQKAGGQLGQRGETVHPGATPPAAVEPRPAGCTQCHTPAGRPAPAAPGARPAPGAPGGGRAASA